MQRMLKVGCQPGPDVMDLQDALNVLLGTYRAGSPNPPLIVNGVFGPQTRLRVMEYQRSRGMLADGVVTVVVWERICVSLARIPGLVVVRPLGGGGAGACVNKEMEDKGVDSAVGQKGSELAVGGNTGTSGRNMGASGRPLTMSATRVISWQSGLAGIDPWGCASDEEEKQTGDEKK
jgi:peptidoglycan hydrolase-like protein with peptidoglycan-binding domain